MLPKWHILFGFLFAYIIYWFTSITIFEASLIFLSSVLIDFDHYLLGAKRNKTLNLKKLYFWHKALPKKHKPIMHIFHTIEIMIIIFILGFFWRGFFFVLTGILFHSLLDLIEMKYHKEMGCREFSVVRYAILSRKNPSKYF